MSADTMTETTLEQWIDIGAGSRDEPLIGVCCDCEWAANTADLVDAMRSLADHRASHGLDPWWDGYKVHFSPKSDGQLDQATIDAAFAEAKRGHATA